MQVACNTDAGIGYHGSDTTNQKRGHKVPPGNEYNGLLIESGYYRPCRVLDRHPGDSLTP